MKKTLIQSLILSIIPLSLFLLLNKFAWADDLSTQLKGRILLQVEANGEAWYVNPLDNQRYFLGRPADAFSLMRQLGLGISNEDFKNLNRATLKKLSGRIILKVQDKGQAYYINPVDLKINFLGRPADAFELMRKLGLGIKNDDLTKIKIKITAVNTGNQSANQPAETQTPTNGQTSTSSQEVIPPAEGNNATTTTENKTDNGTIVATTTESCKFAAEYYDNISLSGGPSVTREEEKVDFYWGNSGPEGLGERENFSARWTANCYFAAGDYKFIADFDDAMKVNVDGQEIIRSWKNNKRERVEEVTVNLKEGKHKVIVEYYEYDNDAIAKMHWEKI